ncbi:MAG TPA: histidine--tRNA ligase, partial [bacterium]
METRERIQPSIQAPRGMHDILPDEAARWQALEARLRVSAARYGYREIRTPAVEHTEIFQRTSGDTSDIVEKEMYTFADRGGRSLSLRPEGTAGVVRAYLEHGMASWPQPVRLYYIAPMFRYDRPQKGRFRLHHQFGAEILGTDAAAADVEVLSLPIRFVQGLGLTEATVRLNSIGDAACRPAYLAALREYFRPHAAEMSQDSQRRLEANPMRILESKEPRDHDLARGAPVARDYLCPACRAHFEQVKRLFAAIGIPYVEDPYIVRGLDYYTRTAAEIHSGRLGGAQHQVLGGGRYDGLAEVLGGPRVPAVGFGLGLERLLLVLAAEKLEAPSQGAVDGTVQLFVATTSGEAEVAGFRLLDRLRTG